MADTHFTNFNNQSQCLKIHDFCICNLSNNSKTIPGMENKTTKYNFSRLQATWILCGPWPNSVACCPGLWMMQVDNWPWYHTCWGHLTPVVKYEKWVKLYIFRLSFELNSDNLGLDLWPLTSWPYDPYCIHKPSNFQSEYNFSNESNLTFSALLTTWPQMAFDLGMWLLTSWTYEGFYITSINHVYQLDLIHSHESNFKFSALQLDLTWGLTLLCDLCLITIWEFQHYINKPGLAPVVLQLFKRGEFHSFRSSYNFSDDLQPWYMTFDCMNIWRFPYYNSKPSLVPIGHQLFKWEHSYVQPILQLDLQWPMILICDLSPHKQKRVPMMHLWPNFGWNPLIIACGR